MEKRKKWHFYLILTVAALTLYNILPTIFYYSQPLKAPVGPKEAVKVAKQAVSRINSLENFTLSWLKAQARNVGVKPDSLTLDPQNPRLVFVKFTDEKQASLFSRSLKRAGALIPFAPAQLSVAPQSSQKDDKTVVVQRKIGVHINPEETQQLFYYVPKKLPNGSYSPEYRRLTYQRAAQLALQFEQEGEYANLIQNLSNLPNYQKQEGIVRLARTLVDYSQAFEEAPAITARFFHSLQTDEVHLNQLIADFEGLKKAQEQQIKLLKDQEKELKNKNAFLEVADQQRLSMLQAQHESLETALKIIKRESRALIQKTDKFDREKIVEQLLNKKDSYEESQRIIIGENHPFVNAIVIDWSKDRLQIELHDDIIALRDLKASKDGDTYQQEKLNHLLFNAIAFAARQSDESITPSLNHFTVELNQLTNSTSLLAFDLGKLANLQAKTLKTMLDSTWNRSNTDLKEGNYPIYTYDVYQTLTSADKKLGLVIYAPSMSEKPMDGFRNGSLYVIAKGMATIRQKYLDLADSPERIAFEQEFRSLQELMKQSGFIGYAAQASGLPKSFENDYVFELDDYYAYLIAATRESFSVSGDKQFALLEFTNLEQRLLAQNKIETQEQEELVKWQDEYQQAQVSLSPERRLDVPKPTQSPLVSNIALSARKYFRGDERKILKWGLDLSGGKTVRIGLVDQNGNRISDEEDLNQAVNELYQRVNRLGLSEVSIHIEGSSIVLDFPGSQALSASELISASAMYFHVVNEQFTPSSPTLGQAVQTFLEEVWNEAVITNRTDPLSLNEIAWQHLGGSFEHPGEFHPLTTHARLLYDNGLRLASPRAEPRSNTVDTTLSSVTRYRGDDFADWQGQTHPLLVVFRNYALEGSDLIDVKTGYSAQEGNSLSFSVKGVYTNPYGERINPRENLYSWTSQYAEDKVAGTPKEVFTNGRGWRMAVILNGSVISAPSLNAALRDSGHITGHFTQREVNQLAADLKAGSLSYTPQILSEQNVSPDLGKEQRLQGIIAALLGLSFMAIIMCGYYRFSGVVACLAVLFNLLIIWAVLQNLGAALTLPGIAGVILAIGMSVDANVLVFERIREEFAYSGRLAAAVQAGYRRAFTAILDSNLTTIIAALILLNFDAGPIKGLALTLIIGILSSMFTALFVTRYFFMGWVQDPKHKELKMMQLFKDLKINFLSKSKFFFIGALFVVLLGSAALYKERTNILGMDFTGGYSLSLTLSEQSERDYRLRAEQALVKAGAVHTDFHIQELNKPNQLRIQLGMGMESPGRPFATLEEQEDISELSLPYQSNPRIRWIVDSLESQGLIINEASLNDLHLHWTEMSGQLSQRMRNQALAGLGLALLAILIYITIRFEFKFALSATLAIAHDLLVSVALIAIFHLFVNEVQIDLQVIAALMTIVGYSLNDTIIIFDRIREDLRFHKKMGYGQMINHALNATLSRTVMTSGTTIAVLLSLVLFGGPTILNFSLVMTLGVVIGTLSSLFIAPPILLYFHNREQTKEITTKTNP